MTCYRIFDHIAKTEIVLFTEKKKNPVSGVIQHIPLISLARIQMHS